ncbi:MAG: DUF1684 domain-containing protein, partial [Chloroflexota bacterium]|nr:DUF1684 domain-containing protein [Chloroflexota bacterium]
MTDPHDDHAGHDHAAHDHEHQEHEHHAIGYVEAVLEFRAEKDAFFKAAPNSPIPAGERDAFAGLPYYPVDEGLRFEDRTLEPYTGDEPSDFQIPTSDGKLRPAHRAGYLGFEIDGARHRLTAYT